MREKNLPELLSWLRTERDNAFRFGASYPEVALLDSIIAETERTFNKQKRLWFSTLVTGIIIGLLVATTVYNLNH